MCFVNQMFLINAIETLVGIGRIESSEGFDVWTDFQIIDQGNQGSKRGGGFAAGILTGFQPVSADCLKGKFLFCGILPFSHQADAGNQSMISPDQRIQIRLQRIADILPQIRRMAAVTAVCAVGDGERQADFPRNLSQCHGCLNIFQRLRHRICHGGCSIHSRCGCRLR